MHRAHLALVAPAVATAVLLSLSGCSGGDSRADAKARPSSSSSEKTSSISASPSPSSSTGVAPATGKLVETSYFTVRAPKHYKVEVMGEDFAISIQGAEAGLNIGIIDETGNAPTLAQLARNERKQSHALHGAPPPTRTTIASRPAYLLVDKGPASVPARPGPSSATTGST